MSTSTKPTNFTERDIALMAAAFQCLENEPKVDTKKLADLSGLAHGSAKNAWYALKKKLETTSAAASPNAKAKAKANGDDNDGGSAVTSPSIKSLVKKAKTTDNNNNKKKKRAFEDEDNGDDDSDDDIGAAATIKKAKVEGKV